MSLEFFPMFSPELAVFSMQVFQIEPAVPDFLLEFSFELAMISFQLLPLDTVRVGRPVVFWQESQPAL